MNKSPFVYICLDFHQSVLHNSTLFKRFYSRQKKEAECVNLERINRIFLSKCTVKYSKKGKNSNAGLTHLLVILPGRRPSDEPGLGAEDWRVVVS